MNEWKKWKEAKLRIKFPRNHTPITTSEWMNEWRKNYGHKNYIKLTKKPNFHNYFWQSQRTNKVTRAKKPKENWNKLNEYVYKVGMDDNVRFFFCAVFNTMEWFGIKNKKIENKIQNLPRSFRSSESCRSIESLHSRSRKTSIFNSAEEKL